MGRLNNYLMQKKSLKRDKYFLDLYLKAFNQVVARGEVDSIDITADDITAELKPLLAHELSYSDCRRDRLEQMYEASMNIGDTLARPPAASDEDRNAQNTYELKFALIQNVLVNYLLGEKEKPKQKLALSHWQIARFTSVCEAYKRDLCLSEAIPEKTKQKKLDAVSELLVILTNKSIRSGEKVQQFIKSYHSNKSTLAGNMPKFGGVLHTPKLFKPPQKKMGLYSFVKDVEHILAQAQKVVLDIVKQFKSQIKQNKSIRDIDNIMRHP